MCESSIEQAVGGETGKVFLCEGESELEADQSKALRKVVWSGENLLA